METKPIVEGTNVYTPPRFTADDIKIITERALPEFTKAVKESDLDFILMTQDAFASDFLFGEMLLLGFAVKYAGLYGKELRIIK